MADLGDSSYVGFTQRLRTSASQFPVPPAGYGLNPGFPSSGLLESEVGAASEAVTRLSLPPVVRPAPQLVWYEMRGRDQDCPTLTYRYWRVSGSPDLTGTSYAGPKCGLNPLVEIIVLEANIGV